MQENIPLEVSQLLKDAEQSAHQGKRVKAYQSSLKATNLAPNEPMAWYLRSRSAPSSEEQLICLSRAYTLDPSFVAAKEELRLAVKGLLKQEPFLAYVHETEAIYQVRSSLGFLVNIPKNRAFEKPYLQQDPGALKPVLGWLYLTLAGLVLGGVGALVFAPITAFQALRLQSSTRPHGDQVRLWIVFIISVLIWLAAIPISLLLLIRFFA
ncbi:MAG TPA: hypothetical protein VGK00_00400 [Anaerolineales bacterium]|jgi:hypothetical protein